MRVEDVRLLTPRQRLVYWIEERESIRLKREAGELSPWTDDSILQSFRFCNVRRMDDAVSKWLMENWYRPYFDHPNMLAACALARFINLPHSLDLIGQYVFRPQPSTLRKGEPWWKIIKNVLRGARDSGPVFNAAYICPTAPDTADKIEAVVDKFVAPLQDAKRFLVRSSMEKTWAKLKECQGFGSFMAGQVVADLRHAVEGEWADRHSWSPRGPGSTAGLNRLRGHDPKTTMTDDQFQVEMNATRDVLLAELPTVITDRLEAHDYQNCMCEFSGYEKVLWGEGRKKEVYRSGKYGNR